MHTITIQLTIDVDTPAKPEHLIDVVEGLVEDALQVISSPHLTIKQDTIEHTHTIESVQS